ncbi:hypothetical protein POM88_033898 [Heracleum sosnowskyi]|uniref:Uncharacterized protein n=1 Tax=Heracleum sosnowskyi TaxID=360622 RepID=A0AAD8HIE2_9APIA|nr:hypothetical protein POM88_033898 [Heracleum sosnowskyi]
MEKGKALQSTEEYSHQDLQKAVADFLSDMNQKAEDFETLIRIDEVMLAACECCGLEEDCTPKYISKVKTSHSGKWLCGLCSEVVKEKMLKAPLTEMDEAAPENCLGAMVTVSIRTRLATDSVDVVMHLI